MAHCRTRRHRKWPGFPLRFKCGVAAFKIRASGQVPSMLDLAVAKLKLNILAPDDRVVAHVTLVDISKRRNQGQKIRLPRIIFAQFTTRGDDDLITRE